MKNCVFQLTIALGALALPLQAQARPTGINFTGKWVMDTARSEKSSFTPKSSTWNVLQQGDSLILDRESPGTGNQHAVYSLSGAPRTFTLRLVGSETPATSTVSWTGNTMVVHTTSRPSEMDLVQNDSWTLSADGKELRIKREASAPGMTLGSPTLVFVKN